jgi:hypothetical protein
VRAQLPVAERLDLPSRPAGRADPLEVVGGDVRHLPAAADRCRGHRLGGDHVDRGHDDVLAVTGHHLEPLGVHPDEMSQQVGGRPALEQAADDHAAAHVLRSDPVDHLRTSPLLAHERARAAILGAGTVPGLEEEAPP